MKVHPCVSTAAGLAAWLAVFVATVSGRGAQQPPGSAGCTLIGSITGAGTPLPGVSLTARRGETVHRATSTAVDGTYQLSLAEGEYSLQAELTGFQKVERAITLDGTPCRLALDVSLVLAPRTTAATAGRGGRGGPAGPAPRQAAQFQTLAVNADASGTAQDAVEPEDTAPLLLPPGFNAEASADAIAVTGNAAQVDRGLLDDRADAFARGELPPNIADLAVAIAANGLAAGGGPAGRGGPGGPGRVGGDGAIALAGRGGRGGRRLQASADYTFGGSALDSSPYQLRGDAPREKRPYTRQSFGTTFGGPLKIPGLYSNTANRTSFQASYTANRGSNLFDQYATVPTDAMRAGDFSSAPAPLIDPATGSPFPDNRIPAGRISPSAQALLALMPSANLPGTTRNLHYTTTTASVNDAVNARVNHTFGSAPAGRGGRGGGRGGGGRGAAGRGGNAQLATTVSLNAQFQYRRSDNDQTNVFSTLGGRNTSTSVSAPVGVNIARGRNIQAINLQLSRTSSRTSNRFAGIENVAGLAGIQGTSADPLAWGAPSLSFSSISGLRDVTPSRRDDSRFGLNYSWTHPLARHALRVGSNIQLDRNSSLSEANANGSFVFTGVYTSGGIAVAPGFDVADFLLGLPQQATVQYGPGTVALHGRSFSAFVQDDWRARGNLTVNLGLRYELLRPFVEEDGQLVNLDVTPDFSAATPVMAGETGPFSGSFPSALLRTDVNNLAPRIGIAWRTRQGLVVRGGYGVSYNSGAYAGFARQLSSQPPFAVTNTQIGALNSILLMENALLGGTPTETTNTFGVDRDYALGRVQTWNAAVQRNLGRSWTVSANYTHTRGSSLDVVRAPNRDAEGLRIDGVQPFLWQSSEGRSVLHSANFELQRRQVRGIGWRVTYALARSRDNAPSIGGGTVVAQNDQDIDAEWGLSNFDRRHRLSANLNADLPFGPNRPWLNNGGPWAALLENWRITATFTADAGTPLSARIRGAASDVSRGLNGALRADYTGADLSVEDPSIDQFFNTSAFALPGDGLFGNSMRNLIIGPGSRQLDASMSRDVRLGGNRAVTIQVRTTNLLNLVNYTAIDTFVNSPTFGQVTSVRPMRSAQLNLRFRF